MAEQRPRRFWAKSLDVRTAGTNNEDRSELLDFDTTRLRLTRRLK